MVEQYTPIIPIEENWDQADLHRVKLIYVRDYLSQFKPVYLIGVCIHRHRPAIKIGLDILHPSFPDEYMVMLPFLREFAHSIRLRQKPRCIKILDVVRVAHMVKHKECDLSYKS